jgi:hypothetical protein
VRRLALIGRSPALREGLTPDEAIDLLYTLNHETYQPLVGWLGWSSERFAEWLTETLIEQLLAPGRDHPLIEIDLAPAGLSPLPSR